MAGAQEVVNSVAGGLKKLVKSTGERLGWGERVYR